MKDSQQLYFDAACDVMGAVSDIKCDTGATREEALQAMEIAALQWIGELLERIEADLKRRH